MGIQFDDDGLSPTIGSEFAEVSVSIDGEANSVRLRLEDLRTGRVRYLDALELETLVWLPEPTLTALMDPSHNRWRENRERAAIVAPVRTAVGIFGGSLRPLRAEGLAVPVIKAVIERSGVPADLIEDVVFAQSYANSEAPCIGRWVALNAGLPTTVPGLQIDRRCGGGLQAVITAAMTVQTGAADVVLAGGVESMSNIEHYTTSARWGAALAIRRSTIGSTAGARCRSPLGDSGLSAG